MSHTPTTPPILPRKLAGRVFRWGAPRFLKVCWLVATGRRGVLSGPQVRLDVAEVDGLEHLPHVAGVLSAMRAGLSPHGGHGLRAILHRLLLFLRDWFRQLQDSSLAQSVASADGAEGHGWIVPDAGNGECHPTSLLEVGGQRIDVPDVCPIAMVAHEGHSRSGETPQERGNPVARRKGSAQGDGPPVEKSPRAYPRRDDDDPAGGSLRHLRAGRVAPHPRASARRFPDLPPPPVRPVSARRPLPVCKPHPVFGKSLSGIP
ncbi:MAG: hypothetical protein R3D03_02775 [Geminicoccaceae bacterium]